MSEAEQTGLCDICGEKADCNIQECNQLSCTFQHCPQAGLLYHQECLENFLRKNKLEKNRKTGFKCPRGYGKGSKFDTPCPGRIDKSHPMLPRNEETKKKKLQAVVVNPEPPKPAKPVPVPNGKAARKEEAAKPAVEAKKEPPKPAAKPAIAPAAPAPVVGAKAKMAAAAVAASKREEALALEKEQLAKAKAALRKEIGLGPQGAGAAAAGAMTATAAGFGAGAVPLKAVAPAAQVSLSAWGKPAGAPEPPVVTPAAQATLGDLPQLQQLIQQAASKKSTASSSANNSPASKAAASISKPLPAGPQPVLNPPKPSWPALSSAAASGSASPSGTPGGGGPSAAAMLSRAASREDLKPLGSQSELKSLGLLRQGTGSPAGLSTAASGTFPRSPSQLALSGSSSSLQQLWPASASSQQQAGTSSGAFGSAIASVESSCGNSTGGANKPPSGLGASSLLQGAAARMASLPAAADSSSSSLAQFTAPMAIPARGGGSAATGHRAVASSLSPASSLPAESLEAEDALAASPIAGLAEAKLSKAQKKTLKRAEQKKKVEGVAAAKGSSRRTSHAGTGAGTSVSTSADAGAGTSTDVGVGASGSGLGGAAAAAGSSTRGGAEVSGPGAERSLQDQQLGDITKAEQDALLEEMFVSCIVSCKLMQIVASLQRLGLPDWLAMAAVQRYGGDVLKALEWALGAWGSQSPQQIMQHSMELSSSHSQEVASLLPDVDISNELTQLLDVQAALGVSDSLLYQCVLDCAGDVRNAAQRMVDQLTVSGMTNLQSMQSAFFSASSQDFGTADAATLSHLASARHSSSGALPGFGAAAGTTPRQGSPPMGAPPGFGGYTIQPPGVGAGSWAKGTASPLGAAGLYASREQRSQSRLMTWLHGSSGHEGSGSGGSATAAGDGDADQAGAAGADLSLYTKEAAVSGLISTGGLGTGGYRPPELSPFARLVPPGLSGAGNSRLIGTPHTDGSSNSGGYSNPSSLNHWLTSPNISTQPGASMASGGYNPLNHGLDLSNGGLASGGAGLQQGSYSAASAQLSSIPSFQTALSKQTSSLLGAQSGGPSALQGLGAGGASSQSGHLSAWRSAWDEDGASSFAAAAGRRAAGQDDAGTPAADVTGVRSESEDELSSLVALINVR